MQKENRISVDSIRSGLWPDRVVQAKPKKSSRADVMRKWKERQLQIDLRPRGRIFGAARLQVERSLPRPDFEKGGPRTAPPYPSCSN